MPSMRTSLLLGSSLLLLACSSSSGTSTTGGNGGSGTGGATTSSSSSSGAGLGGGGINIDAGGGGKGGGSSCDPPDAIIALDRTLTMHKTPNGGEPTDAPDYQSSKFYQAITAIEKLVAPPTDATIRFGLDLWPKESPGCVTLAEKITGTMGTNPSCEDGEIVVQPALDTGKTIADTLDPATTKICFSTPTGQGLLTASGWLSAHPVAGRAQYIILVTDGADWEQSCPTPDPLAVTQQLAAAGIKTFIVGFSAQGDLMPGGVGAPFLNDMACAGQTAPGFPAPCMMTSSGWVSKDPNGAALYLAAGDSGALDAALHSIAVEVCCDCVH
jgi:hypothetical protein